MTIKEKLLNLINSVDEECSLPNVAAKIQKEIQEHNEIVARVNAKGVVYVKRIDERELEWKS